MIDDEIYDVDAQSRTASRYLHDHGLFTESRLIDELLKEKQKLLDQLEVAQKDAARYRWVRTTYSDDGIEFWPDAVAFADTAEKLDAAIDIALSSQA